ncbi:MAG TPA: hypothetical protein DCP31_08690 [Cyanobacteria bacterium UBA8543]|nr:hypothetical protein [Cyanobacteria bacterium UBA8543]
MTNIIAVSSKAITKLTTPQLLKGGLYLTWGTSLLLLIATIMGVQGQRYSIKTVGKDAVPSIMTAQRIKDALAGMDANAVNELLVKPGQNPSAVKDYEERRQKLADRLVAAAENITYNDERQPIQTLQLAQGEYIAKIQRARDFNERGDANGVVVTYREAAEIMDKTLLPAADALDKANSTQLEQVYAAQQLATGRSLFPVVIFGLFLIGVLVKIQVFLYYRMRRILNPMLLAATAIALIFLGYTTQALLSASYHLKVAKKDAFESMHALRQMRAFAYSMNADESRYLLDKALAAKHEQAFFEKTAKIAQVPNGQTFETVVAALAQGQKVDGLLTGYIADEFKNITFPGEQEAAVATLKTFGIYFNIDKQIRQLEQSGKHESAIALCVGTNPGQSNWAFTEFLKANNQAFDINQKAFDEAVNQGFKDVDGFEISTPVVAVLVGLLTFFGLRSRLKEYEL